jgi:hypothetical protein
MAVKSLIDINNERPFSPKEAACYISDKFRDRRGGRPLNISTVHRWIGRGLRGIRLEAVSAGGTRFTTAEAIHRFFDRLAGREPAAVGTTSISQKRRVAAAEKSLEQAGI